MSSFVANQKESKETKLVLNIYTIFIGKIAYSEVNRLSRLCIVDD